ncbi:hypothetical protein BJV82DRAFT_613917 [Fennellomyces sp. T-0311]|nr:hypothetical protein BJV82DRAFT_613917 [Fennellomyces sp. T-0311]
MAQTDEGINFPLLFVWLCFITVEIQKYRSCFGGCWSSFGRPVLFGDLINLLGGLLLFWGL